MSIKMTNPITGEEEIFSRKFGYEVGDRSVAVSLNKMNVMYIGVENPISISAAGISTTDMNVSANGINLTKKSSGEYIAIPERKGEATITVSGGSLDPTTLKYKIKKIPNPTMKLGNNTGGSIRLAEFKAQQGLIPILENFDFDAKCSVDGFEITRVRNGDAATAKNRKARFGSETRRLIDKAALKDIFYFNNIKVRCPGDDAGRKMPEMFFNIK
jgi:hypothetical protein